MLNLLERYSLSEILTFLVIFALALKGCITFFDWAKDKIKQFVYKEERPQKIQNRVNTIEERQAKYGQMLDNIINKLDLLIDSDRDDIKAYITEKHHYYVYQKKWVDDYTMNVIQKRYSHYKREGGNSFIRGLMDELRALPKQPVLKREKINKSE